MSQASPLLQSQYLPCIDYLSLCASVNSILIEQHENYVKGSFRNRVHISSSSGLLRLSIPLEKGKNQKQPVKDVRISYDENWQRVHWQSLQSAYNNSPYFDFHKDELEVFYNKRVNFLIDWNTELLRWLLSAFKLKTSIQFTDTYVKEPLSDVLDARDSFNPKLNEDTGFSYPQLFESKTGFLPNLSSVDLLFNVGADKLPKKQSPPTIGGLA